MNSSLLIQQPRPTPGFAEDQVLIKVPVGYSAQHPASTHQLENADSSVSLKTCSALQPLNQNLAAVNTSSRIHYSVSGKSNYLWGAGKNKGGGDNAPEETER